MKYLVLLALLGSVFSQETLNSYNRIRNSLVDGNEVTLNAFTVGCRSQNVEANFVVSMTLRHWEIVDPVAGAEEIRSDDYYIDTADSAAITYITRAANIYSDDTVRVTISSADTGTGEVVTVILDCDLGDGATAHEIVGGGVANVNNYNDLKRDLLLGDHVEAVAFLNGCQGAEQLQANFIVGYQIQRFEVFGDGTPDQFIVFDDVALLSADGTTFSVATDQVIAYPDNTASVKVAFLDTDLNPINSIDLTCDLGSDLRFHIHRREQPGSYVTYEEIRESTLAGHDMEFVAFLTFCTIEEGEAFETTGTIVSARFDEFELYKADEAAGEIEYLSYSAWGLGANGQVYVDVVRAYSDGHLTIEYFLSGSNNGTEGRSGLLNCPLGDGSLFHAVSRDREPLTEYGEIAGNILGRGRVFEVEIDFDQCTGSTPLSIIFGGIAWQSYVAPGPDGFFYADISAVIIENLTGNLGIAWEAAGVAVFPDNSVRVTGNLYDFFSGETLLDDAGIESLQFECLLGQGVQFFRYP